MTTKQSDRNKVLIEAFKEMRRRYPHPSSPCGASNKSICEVVIAENQEIIKAAKVKFSREALRRLVEPLECYQNNRSNVGNKTHKRGSRKANQMPMANC